MNVIKQLEERERNIIFNEEDNNKEKKNIKNKINNIIKNLEERKRNIIFDEDKNK